MARRLGSGEGWTMEIDPEDAQSILFRFSAPAWIISLPPSSIEAVLEPLGQFEARIQAIPGYSSFNPHLLQKARSISTKQLFILFRRKTIDSLEHAGESVNGGKPEPVRDLGNIAIGKLQHSHGLGEAVPSDIITETASEALAKLVLQPGFTQPHRFCQIRR